MAGLSATAHGADVVDVRVENVRKRYGSVEALRGVSLAFAAGRLTAILGPSGCGKTTLLRSIAGFVRVDAGTIRFAGEDVTARPPQARATAMVFQSYALWPHMTVFDNVAYGLRLRRLPRSEIRERVLASLALVEIGDIESVAQRKPGALSGGQQQRVAVARALVVEPRVLLLDEPLSNLDAKVRQRLRVEIRQLQRRVGITTVYVTHDQEEALAIADRIVLMGAGQVVQVGTLSSNAWFHSPINRSRRLRCCDPPCRRRSCEAPARRRPSRPRPCPADRTRPAGPGAARSWSAGSRSRRPGTA